MTKSPHPPGQRSSRASRTSTAAAPHDLARAVQRVIDAGCVAGEGAEFDDQRDGSPGRDVPDFSQASMSFVNATTRKLNAARASASRRTCV